MSGKTSSDHADYLHRCLGLFGDVTEIRYGKRQRLGEVEREVAGLLAKNAELWEVVHAIYNSPHFDADIFGPLDVDRIKDDLKEAVDRDWRSLPEHELIEMLYSVFRQIEPVSVVMRFICPKRFGMVSSPVATLLGVRPRRRATATYGAYVKSLREIRDSCGFKRAADVEMALWALNVGALDQRLPDEQGEPLRQGYEGDVQLRRLATRNLTKQLFAENTELGVADALLDINPKLAGKIAGIEFEQLVSKWVLGAGGKGVERPVSLPCCLGKDQTLFELIEAFTPADMRGQLHHAREIRNRAVHCPPCVAKEDVRRLIEVAQEVQRLIKQRA